MARRRFQKGRLFLRGKKTPAWIGRWREDTITPAGSLTRIEKSAVLGTKAELPTRRLAVRRLELLLARINAPSYRPVRVSSLLVFAERWKAEILAQRKPSTRKAAESHLRVHILPELGAMNLDQIGRENQQVFATRLSKTVSRKTVLNVLGTLSSMLKKAKEWGYVCEGVEFEKLALPEASIGVVPPFFQRRRSPPDHRGSKRTVLDHVRDARNDGNPKRGIVGPPGGRPRFRAAIDFYSSLGMVWPSSNSQKQGKPRRASIARAAGGMLKSYLETWKPNPQQLLFPNQIGRPMSANKVVQRKLWPILDALKIPRCGLHAFRHTHSSLLVEGGAPVSVAQAQLRHADPRITLAVYSHVVGDSQRNAVEKLATILRPNAPKSEPDGKWIQ